MNKYEKLTIHDYEDIYELADLMNIIPKGIDDESDYGSVAVYGKSEFIWEMFEILAYEYDVKIGAVDINRFHLDDCYGAEYSLRIFDDGMMVVEPARNKDGELYCINDIAFIYQEDCEQDLINRALEDEAIVTLFGFEECCGECCHECDCGLHKCDTDKSAVSSASTTPTVSYKVNGKECSKEEYEKKRNEIIKDIDKFEDEFLDMFENAIRTKARIMDDFDRLLRLW